MAVFGSSGHALLAPAPDGDLVDAAADSANLSFDILWLDCIAGLRLVFSCCQPRPQRQTVGSCDFLPPVSVLVLCPAFFLVLFCRGDVSAALMTMDGEVVAAGSITAGAHRGRRYFSIFIHSFILPVETNSSGV